MSNILTRPGRLLATKEPANPQTIKATKKTPTDRDR